MSNLSPSAQILVRGAANAARPSEADRARIFEALQGRLGEAAMLGQASTALPPPPTSAIWGKLSAATVGLGLVVGTAVVGLRPEAPQSAVAAAPARHVEASSLAAPAELPLPLDATNDAASPAVRATRPNEPSSIAPRRQSDRLAEEVALLSRATSALRGGKATDALKTLNEHQSRFPKGMLSEERSAARAQALCALGRRAEAERELARLPQSSPQAARVRQLCSPAR
jgi:hypothetical protein